jgi:signal transduction histidine kinase/sugar lactone lactonase YvrE
MWVAGSSGVWHWRNGNFTQESSVKEAVTALLCDRQKRLWMAKVNGELLCSHGGTTERISGPEGLSDVRALAQDEFGRIWAGTEHGRVFFQSSQQFTSVALPEARGQVRFIVPDRDETIWIGVKGAGLYRWHAGQVSHWALNTALGTQELCSMVIENENLWVGTARGAFKAARRELERAVDEGKPLEHFSVYDRNDGVPVMEYALGFRSGAIRSHDGHLWFATAHGALEVKPEDLRDNEPASRVQIDEVQIGNSSVPGTSWEGLTLPPSPALLQIRYTLPELSTPSQLRFRYRLIGAGNDDWITGGSERLASFAHLRAGEYRFEVAAAKGTGSWLPQTATLSFKVRPAWWDTAWFRLGLSSVLALIVALLARYAVNRRIRMRMLKLEQEHALERERTRIARDMHDELGANLTQIAVVSKIVQLESPETVSNHIQEIASAARQAIVSLDEIVWAVNPRHDTLSSLVSYLGEFAANFLRANGIACKLAFPKHLPDWRLSSSVRHHLFLVAKEAVNNAAKYSEASSVSLNIDVEGGLFRLAVTDDGCGFEIGDEHDNADGLRNMHERMAEIGGECWIESSIGQGTRVTFKLLFPDHGS